MTSTTTTQSDSTAAAVDLEVTTLGGGCFWCLEAVFDQVQGVVSVESGYSGGHVANPTYRQVCAETSGHAEVVQVTFDRRLISFGEILEIFFTIHDPTTLNRQGADAGTQHRSVIFTHSPEQQKAAAEAIVRLEAAMLWDAPVVTEIAPLKEFYVAEDYHQEYYAQNERQPYCQVVISPKLAKFRAKFRNKVKA